MGFILGDLGVVLGAVREVLGAPGPFWAPWVSKNPLLVDDNLDASFERVPDMYVIGSETSSNGGMYNDF